MEEQRDVLQLLRTNVRRVAPRYQPVALGKMTCEGTHLDTDVGWEADERNSDVVWTRWTDMSSC